MPSSTIQQFSRAIDLLMDRKIEQSLELFREIKDIPWIIECLNRLKRHAELIEYYENNFTTGMHRNQPILPVRFFLQVATAYRNENDLTTAKKILLKSLKTEKTAETYLLLADIFIAEEKPEKTLKAIKNARILMNNANSFEIHELLGDYYHLINDYEKAIEQYRQVDELKEEIARFKEFISQYSLVLDGGNLFASFRPFIEVTDNDLPFLKKSLIETADEVEKSKILNRLGNYYSKKGDYDKANCFFGQALSNANEKLVSFILNNQAIIDVKRGEYLSAERKMRESYQKLKVHGVRIEVAYCLNNLAKIIELLGNVRKARNLYSKSLQILEQCNDGRGMTVVLINLANHFRLSGHINKGLEYYLHAHEIFQGDDSLLALLYQSVAELYWTAGCYDIALKRSEQARKLYERLGIQDYYYGYNQLLLSAILADLNRVDAAKTIITGVEELNTVSLRSKSLEANILLRKGVIEQKQRNYGNAENLFQRIPENQFLPYIESLFHSAEIKSREYLTTMDELYFEETVVRIQKVIKKAEESNFYQLLSESYLILGTLETARFNYGEAIILSKKAIEIAKAHNLLEQHQKASSWLENLQVKLQQTKQLMENQKPASDDMEEFQDYLKEALSIVKTRRLKEN
ncbi:MAG: tetratricopeptide repeat protein [Candidatus Odinarchaeota archaeon]